MPCRASFTAGLSPMACEENVVGSPSAPRMTSYRASTVASIRDVRLRAVIDFGYCGIGDPACDPVMAWTYFAGTARDIFREAVRLVTDTCRRARGWALWKALVAVAGMSSPDPTGTQVAASPRPSASQLEPKAPAVSRDRARHRRGSSSIRSARPA